jgi:hypothetical protein
LLATINPTIPENHGTMPFGAIGPHLPALEIDLQSIACG